MLEGNPRTNAATGTVTRAIYILDVAAFGTRDGVVLFVYTKTDVITPDFDTVTVDFSASKTLELTGGPSAQGLLAANKSFLLLGTNLSPSALRLDKRGLAATEFGPFSGNLSSITADQYGYITADFADDSFFTIGPDGNDQQSGGGNWFMLNTIQGIPARFP